MTRTRHPGRKFLETLRHTWLFADCSERELRLISSLLTPVDVEAGRVLAREGEVGRECFVVIHGHAVVERSHAIIGHVVDGSIVGEVALMTPVGRRNATVTAATPMEMLVMSRTEFAALRGLGIRSVERRLLDAFAAHSDTVGVAAVAPTEPSAGAAHQRVLAGVR